MGGERRALDPDQLGTGSLARCPDTVSGGREEAGAAERDSASGDEEVGVHERHGGLVARDEPDAVRPGRDRARPEVAGTERQVDDGKPAAADPRS